MAASEALSLIALTSAEIDSGLALSAAAGWNQTADDWALFIGQGHAVGFRTASGVLVATAAAIAYSGGLGWISMVLVAPEWRHRGLASLLLESCIKRLQAAHVTPVLDATSAGAPVYRHLGFRTGFDLERWERAQPPPSAAGDRAEASNAVAATAAVAEPRAGYQSDAAADIRPATAADLDVVAALDESAIGIGRRSLLQNFFARSGTRAWIIGDGGFVVARAGLRATQIGPLIAADANAALRLLAVAIAAIAGPVFLDVPNLHRELGAWLEQAGFARQRPYVRMALGSASPLVCPERVFVLAGPEFG